MLLQILKILLLQGGVPKVYLRCSVTEKADNRASPSTQSGYFHLFLSMRVTEFVSKLLAVCKKKIKQHSDALLFSCNTIPLTNLSLTLKSSSCLKKLQFTTKISFLLTSRHLEAISCQFCNRSALKTPC